MRYIANFYRQKGDKDKAPRKKNNIARNLAIAGIAGTGIIGGSLLIKKRLQRVAKTSIPTRNNIANIDDDIPYYQTRKHTPTNENIKDFTSRRTADNQDFIRASSQHFQNVVDKAARKNSPEMQRINEELDKIFKTPFSEFLEKAELASKWRQNKKRVNVNQIQKRLPPLKEPGLYFKSNLFLINF